MHIFNEAFFLSFYVSFSLISHLISRKFRKMNSIIYNDTMINTSISFSFYNFLDKFLKKLVENLEERFIYFRFFKMK